MNLNNCSNNLALDCSDFNIVYILCYMLELIYE